MLTLENITPYLFMSPSCNSCIVLPGIVLMCLCVIIIRVCYNKNMIIALCPLQHVHFGIVTETGACTGEEKEEEELTEEDTKGVHMPHINTNLRRLNWFPGAG